MVYLNMENETNVQLLIKTNFQCMLVLNSFRLFTGGNDDAWNSLGQKKTTNAATIGWLYDFNEDSAIGLHKAYMGARWPSGLERWLVQATGLSWPGSNPTAENFASELWQFRLPRFASVFRRRH